MLIAHKLPLPDGHGSDILRKFQTQDAFALRDQIILAQ